MRPRRFAWMTILLALPLPAAEMDWKARLAAAIARATGQNPEIAERESRIDAARHRVGQATALPDPEIEIGIQDIPPSDFSFSRDDFTMEKITARQRIPGAGKRSALRRSAEADVEAISAMHADHVSSLAADVADAFFASAELDTRIRILEASRERLGRAASSAGQRYRVGKGAQADVLRANLEVTATEVRLAELRGERRMRAARFNALQALTPATSVESLALPEQMPSVAAAVEVVRSAEMRSPAVASATAQVKAAEEQRIVARLERRPDWTAMGYYAHRVHFDDLVGASIALNLPFFQPRRLREKEAEMEAGVSGARATLEMVKNEIRQGVEEAYADLERSMEQVGLYRDSILPQADTNERAAREGYSVGQIDFLTYVRAALDRDTYEAELATRQAGAWRAVAALQKASGLPLIPGTPGAGEVQGEN